MSKVFKVGDKVRLVAYSGPMGANNNKWIETYKLVPGCQTKITVWNSQDDFAVAGLQGTKYVYQNQENLVSWELVDAPPFKPGDRVRKVTGFLSPYDATVVKYNDGTLFVDKEGERKHPDDKWSNADDAKHFVLVEETKEAIVSEVEALINKVNEGIKAHYKLVYAYPNRASYTFNDGSEPRDPLIGRDHRVRCDYDKDAYLVVVPDKPKFEMFDVSAGTVKFDGTSLSLGCQTFSAITLKEALKFLLASGGEFVAPGFEKAFATQTGIRNTKGSVTWAEAKKIYDALEKAGV